MSGLIIKLKKSVLYILSVFLKPLARDKLWKSASYAHFS